MPIDPMPIAPSSARPATFTPEMDAFLPAMDTFATQANALAADVLAKQILATAAAIVAQQALDAGLANAAANASAAQAAAAAAVISASLAQATNPDAPIRLNPRTITADTTISAGYNASSTGPITIADGVTVTISENSSWSIV